MITKCRLQLHLFTVGRWTNCKSVFCMRNRLNDFLHVSLNYPDHKFSLSISDLLIVFFSECKWTWNFTTSYCFIRIFHSRIINKRRDKAKYKTPVLWRLYLNKVLFKYFSSWEYKNIKLIRRWRYLSQFYSNFFFLRTLDVTFQRSVRKKKVQSNWIKLSN